MERCKWDGNADMYGLGIRLGFYLQWFASLLANILILQKEILGLRLALTAFMWGTFVALLVQTVRDTLAAVDIYIVLLMCFGYKYFIVPTFLWRLITWFDFNLDPTRWTVSAYSTVFYIFWSLLLVATSAYQLWFWISGIHPTSNGCIPSGFLFTKLPLNSPALRGVNIGFQVLLLIVALLGPLQYCKQDRKKYLQPLAVKVPKKKGRTLQHLHSSLKAMVVTIVIIATELSIRWNNISGVNTLDSAGQLIPFLVGLFMCIRVVLERYRTKSPFGKEIPIEFKVEDHVVTPAYHIENWLAPPGQEAPAHLPHWNAIEGAYDRNNSELSA